ncbi:putative receptor protein kinase ZmPK1 [Hordeum vulgare]|nr:putative receptor protein kinase ZmPK1 [Hordeum vulgare]
MSTMGVGSNNSHWSQTNEVHFDDHEFEVDEDGEGVNEETNKHRRSIDLGDDEAEASSDDGKRSPTPNTVAYSKPKRPNGGKKDAKEKKKRKGDDELTIAMEAIVNARKEANEVTKMARNQDATVEVRRLAAEERRVAAEERKVALKEKKLVMEERTRLLEWEKSLIFMDTSTLDEKQKEYVNLAREEVLVQKRGMRGMGGFEATMGDMCGMGDMGGMGAMGAMGGMGGMGGMCAMGGMGGFGATMGGMGGMSFTSPTGGMGAPPDDMGGMGAPTGDMGGRMSSGVSHVRSYDAVEDLANPFRAPHDDAARHDEEEEEEMSSDEEEESEEEEDQDEGNAHDC